MFSLRKRRKAIRHKVTKLECERLIEKNDCGDLEKIEINIIVSKTPGKLPLTIHIWEDRWIWIDVRLWNIQTWEWGWTMQGRFLPILSGKDFINAIEKTIETTFEMTQSEIDEFTLIWRRMLASGPKEVTNF